MAKKGKKLHKADILPASAFLAVNALGAMHFIGNKTAEIISAILVIAFGAMAGWRTRNIGVSAFIWWSVSVIALFCLINIIIKYIM